MNPAVSNKLSFLPESLAEIDGTSISRDELAQILSENVPAQELPGFLAAPEEAIRAEAKRFAESEIDRILMSKMAENAGYPSKKEAVERDFDHWLSRLSATQKADFEAKLAQQSGTTLEAYRAQMCGDLRQQGRLAVSTWLQEKVYINFKIEDSEIKLVYDSMDPAQLTSPPQVKVAHIPFRHDGTAEQRSQAEQRAKTVLDKINAGADFEAMVKENPSSEGHLKRLGILDFFSPGTYNENFEKAAFSLQPKQVSSLVETPDGFEILKCLEIKSGSVLPLEQVSGKIREDLFGKLATKAIDQLLEQGKREHQVSIKI